VLAEQIYSSPSLEQAYAHCRRIALGHYENFPVASWLLPRELRPHIYAIYAYCRGVDDIGDEAEGDRLALLDEWEAELRRAYDACPSDIRFVALAETVRRIDIPIEPFERLIEANRRDQRVSRYATFDELLEYCTYSANPVGHLVLYMFGYRDEARRRLADATCTALQLTNFWQDVREDLEHGRIYIPQDDLAAFGCSEDELFAGRVSPQFRRMMAFQVERTRKYFRKGLRLLDQVDGRFRMDLRLFNLGGLAVLDAIERQGYDVLKQRPRLSKAQKGLLVIRGVSPVRVRVRA
jgi:squalene synthase HpnC